MTLESLTKKADIDRVMKTGKSARDPLCGMRYLPNEKGTMRIVFLIGTKLDKRAVVRNRLRRQYRHIVNALVAAPGPSVDIIFFPSKQAIETPYEERLESLQALLAKYKLTAKKDGGGTDTSVSSNTVA